MTVPTSLQILQVDAFTAEPFAGNPAAVCVLAAPVDEDWMRAIAAEMNLSETAFLHPVEDGYHLRWFTPTTEVDLCGHATLASAHVLWSEGHLDPGATARFHTRSGLLTARLEEDWITLNFPRQPMEPISPDPVLLKALRGQEPLFVGGSTTAIEGNYLVELASEAHVRSLQPDFSLMATLPVMGVIVTSAAEDPAVDFVSRYFAPAAGINEDPVTGSAHCSLAPYWQEKLGKDTFLARQVSTRGGLLKVTCQADRVLISGQAITVLRGDLIAQL
ncbi:PhzF family phenazine biosynthesis protein [Leptolyngbya sp. PCC 6406]|uniref:PhzF family phenazine biosynthesis protein n=1 Tax=Leptolyngbya sp. PCC 6406 TaxID=1173264 RepID=UPI0002AC0108|nr:PhzF family phenazine biosynthesis protein [Leptolyngbya sp. PCC 6406]